MRVAVVVLSFVAVLSPGFGARAQPPSVFLEDLTWPEVRTAVQSGTTTIIVPAGGTEQNGLHMALGKHNTRAKLVAGKIAAVLGDTLVAPVLAYTPEGTISPPSGHMRFPGTISIPDAAFKSTLEAAGRSFKQAGFTHVVLIGDHGGYQTVLKDAAADLDRTWAGTAAHAHWIADYYKATQTAYVRALRARGLSDAEIGSHAGAADTSLMLALDPSLVRSGRLAAKQGAAEGTLGDPRGSTATLGQLGVDLIVTQTVAAIRRARTEKH